MAARDAATILKKMINGGVCVSDGEKKKKFPWAAESQVLRTLQGFPPHAPSTEMLGARGSSSPSTLAAPPCILSESGL